MKFNKKYFFFCFILLMILMNNTFSYSWLKEDKNDLLSKVNYIDEPSEEPVLRDMYQRALDCYKNNDFANTVFFYKKLLDVRKNYKDSVFLLEVVEKMMNYPIIDAKDIVVNEYFEKGKEYYDDQHYLAALNIWEKLLILESKNDAILKKYVIEARRLLADPYYERGWDYYKNKQYDKAIEEWEHVLALVPIYQGLELLLEKTREKNSEVTSLSLMESARQYYDKEMYKKVISTLQDIFKIAPKHEEGNILYKKTIALMKTSYSKYYDYGVNRFSNRDFDKAIDSFVKAFNYANGLKEEGKCNSYISKSKYEIAKMRVVVKKEKEVVTQKVDVVQKEETEKTRYIDQEEVRKRYAQGLYYYKNGYTDKAISEWEFVLSLDPENERAYSSLQMAKLSLNKHK